MRREFTRKVRAAIVLRSLNVRGHVTCEGCGQVLARKPFEIDHVIAEALVVDKSAPLTAKDGQLLGYCCHRGVAGKTAVDVGRIAKSKRAERKIRLGIRQSRRPMDGSKDSRFRKRMNGRVELR